MDRDVRLKQFAGALFSYVYREYNSTFDLPVKLPHVFNHHAASDCSEEEGKAVMKLCLSLRSVFNNVFVRSFPNIQKSTQHFMTFLTSRCLKLCGDDLFLSFMMICAFIAELNLFCWINGCFAFMNTAPKCLTAIFNRRLNKEFYANGGWERLRLFCENFVQMNGKISEHESVSQDTSNGGVLNPSLLSNIKELLDQNSSSEDDSTSSSESNSSSSTDEMEDVEEESESEVEMLPSVQRVESEDDSESSEESESMESDESDDVESLESGEIISKPNGIKQYVDSDDDESESSEESEPSSMSDEESESEDSEPDAAPNMEQINCIKPIMQENLSIEKKIL